MGLVELTYQLCYDIINIGVLMKKTLQDLKKLLSTHDFYYSYSDDHDSYKKGSEEMDVIRSLIKELGKPGEDLYAEYIKKIEVGELSVDGIKEWQV